jgi:hypothetical protein
VAAAAHKGLVELDMAPKQAVDASALSETASMSAAASDASAAAKVGSRVSALWSPSASLLGCMPLEKAEAICERGMKRLKSSADEDLLHVIFLYPPGCGLVTYRTW